MEDRYKIQELRLLLTLGMLYPCKVVSFVTRRGPVTGVMMYILCSSNSTASRYSSLRMEGSQDIQYWYTKPSMLLLYFIIVEVQVREEYPILYSHKTQLNIKLSLLPYYNITTTCFGLNYRPSSGCI